jgi:hypothetical protein
MKLWKFGNITRDLICEPLGVTYGGYTCKVSFMSGKDLLFKAFLTHGRKSITSSADDPLRIQANLQLVLKRHLQNKAGDCMLMCKGHAHKLITVKPSELLYLTDNGKEIMARYTKPHSGGYIPPYLRFYACTGSFLRTYAPGIIGYGETGEYDPVELGYIVAEIREGEIRGIRKVTV